MSIKDHAVKIDEYTHEIPENSDLGMNAPVKIYGNHSIYKMLDRGVFQQIINVSKLPGLVGHVMTMPDAHWGYGFPIGGVAAFDVNEGVISPGGIGFDINCGMRMITTNLTVAEVKPKIRELINTLYDLIPAGVGKKGSVRLSMQQFSDVAETGTEWCIENGYGWDEDLERQENNGCLSAADFSVVSDKAKSRGIKQLGTLGSGNHYCEVQTVNQIFDPDTAKIMGVKDKDQVVIMVHCGSRGFGHQIASDYLREFLDKMETKWNIPIYEKELSAAPINSEEGQNYLKAMSAAANYGFANRQVIMSHVRRGFEQIFGRTAEDMEMNLVYDVAHNIAKQEEYLIDGKTRQVIVHRKGATRSFGPNSKDIPSKYQSVGQPVILGGSMETGSYLLAGTEAAMSKSFGSTAHGSGRAMSRSKAKKKIRGNVLRSQMEAKGIYVRAASMTGLAEEAGFAYKNINDVVDSIHGADLSRKIAQLVPIGNIKG
ncbi:RNA-splicing ligase RtcB [Candidatus Heimdallarchaeota archaeon B3_Heim]|nr:MAG: RNA-splicing ligase RtcB [Candidatus Heimdallarchaeota archaeon B3_Heim]